MRGEEKKGRTGKSSERSESSGYFEDGFLN